MSIDKLEQISDNEKEDEKKGNIAEDEKEKFSLNKTLKTKELLNSVTKEHLEALQSLMAKHKEEVRSFRS